ncbi:hypothetical protein [Nitratireductor indicus]|uniref:hypothetical protein n=1 Tax=Nitratireductor indicus TaxID=721133 RepID=UPI0011603724|nr:hypothetical protein [Nitratireductor indicus]
MVIMISCSVSNGSLRYWPELAPGRPPPGAAGHKVGLILKGALMLSTMRHYKGKIGEKCRLRHFDPPVWPPYVASRTVLIVNRLFTMIGEL